MKMRGEREREEGVRRLDYEELELYKIVCYGRASKRQLSCSMYNT